STWIHMEQRDGPPDSVARLQSIQRLVSSILEAMVLLMSGTAHLAHFGNAQIRSISLVTQSLFFALAGRVFHEAASPKQIVNPAEESQSEHGQHHVEEEASTHDDQEEKQPSSRQGREENGQHALASFPLGSIVRIHGHLLEIGHLFLILGLGPLLLHL